MWCFGTTNGRFKRLTPIYKYVQCIYYGTTPYVTSMYKPSKDCLLLHFADLLVLAAEGTFDENVLLAVHHVGTTTGTALQLE